MRFTILILYPTDRAALARWSNGLFAVYCLLGFATAMALVGSLVLALTGHAVWLCLGLFALSFVFGGLGQGIEPLLHGVDERRHTLDMDAMPAAWS